MAPVLLIAAASDLRELRIPNKLSLVALAIFAGCAPLLSVDDILMRLLAAGLVFGVCFLLFALRILAGGDVKLLSVLMLFIPTPSLLLFGYVFSGSMLIGVLLIVFIRKYPIPQVQTWASVQQENALPMGISIALAGLVHLLLLPLLIW